MKNIFNIVCAVVLVAALTFAACGPAAEEEEEEEGEMITSEEAIQVAIQKVEEDGVMSLDGRDTEVAEEADYWHIYFPFTLHEVRGGEPHVLVAKSNGEVIEIYYTE